MLAASCPPLLPARRSSDADRRSLIAVCFSSTACCRSMVMLAVRVRPSPLAAWQSPTSVHLLPFNCHRLHCVARSSLFAAHPICDVARRPVPRAHHSLLSARRSPLEFLCLQLRVRRRVRVARGLTLHHVVCWLPLVARRSRPAARCWPFACRRLLLASGRSSLACRRSLRADACCSSPAGRRSPATARRSLPAPRRPNLPIL